MSIKINVNELNETSELLISATPYFDNAINNIQCVLDNLDNIVLNNYLNKITTTKKSISQISKQTTQISNDISKINNNYQYIESQTIQSYEDKIENISGINIYQENEEYNQEMDTYLEQLEKRFQIEMIPSNSANKNKTLIQLFAENLKNVTEATGAIKIIKNENVSNVIKNINGVSDKIYNNEIIGGYNQMINVLNITPEEMISTEGTSKTSKFFLKYYNWLMPDIISESEYIKKGSNIFTNSIDIISDAVDFHKNYITGVNQKILNKLFEKTGNPIIDTLKLIPETLLRTGASVVNFAVSLIIGVFSFVESIIDTAILIVGAAVSLIYLIVELPVFIASKIFGFDYPKITKIIFNFFLDLAGFKGVQKLVDLSYDYDIRNNMLDQLSYKWFQHDGIGCKVGEGIGYFAAMIAATIAIGIATGGSGIGAAPTTAAVSAGASTASAATTTATGVLSNVGTVINIGKWAISTGQLALTAAVSGFGKHAQDARAEGASGLGTYATGIFGSIFEAVTMFLGGEIQGKIGQEVAVKIVGESASPVVQSIATHTTRVTLDSLLGGAESFYYPFEEALYKNGYYNSSGLFVEFPEDATLAEKYKLLFEENGGWNGVFTQLIISALISSLTEGIEISGELKGAADANYDGSIRKMLTEKTSEFKQSIPESASELKPSKIFEAIKAEKAANGKLTIGSLKKIISDVSEKSGFSQLVNKISTKYNNSLDKLLTKNTSDINAAMFTEAIESTSTISKLKALVLDTAPGRVMKSVNDSIGNSLNNALLKRINDANSEIINEAINNPNNINKIKRIITDMIIDTKVGSVTNNAVKKVNSTMDDINLKVLGQDVVDEISSSKGIKSVKYSKAYIDKAKSSVQSGKQLVSDKISSVKSDIKNSILEQDLVKDAIKMKTDVVDAVKTNKYVSPVLNTKKVVTDKINDMNLKILGQETIDKINSSTGNKASIYTREYIKKTPDMLKQGTEFIKNKGTEIMNNTQVQKVLTNTKSVISDKLTGFAPYDFIQTINYDSKLTGVSKRDIIKQMINDSIGNSSFATNAKSVLSYLYELTNNNIDIVKLGIKNSIPDDNIISTGRRISYSVGR